MTENNLYLNQDIATPQVSTTSSRASSPVQTPPRHWPLRTWVMPLFAMLFLLCLWSIVTPLSRLSTPLPLRQLPTNGVLSAIGSWLPSDLHLTTNKHFSTLNTDNIEFLLILAVACGIYGLC